MAVATFDYGLWAATYPELAGSVDSSLATAYFNQAVIYLDNTDCSPVTDVTMRLTLLNMIVAHIAKLSAPINGQAPLGVPGQVTGASEGSVSVNIRPIGSGNSDLEAWFNQTTYGANFWAATTPYRTFQYVPGPQPNFGPWPFGYVGRGGSPYSPWPWPY